MKKILNITKNLVSAGVFLSFFVTTSLVMMASGAEAQTKKEDRKYANVKTKRVKPLPAKLNKDFGKMAKCMEQEPADTNCVLEYLNKWKAKGDSVPAHARVKIHNYFGYIYSTLGDYPKAIIAYEDLLATPEVDRPSEDAALMTLSQLYLQKGLFTKTIKYMKRWISHQDEPTITSMMIVAKAYFSIANDSEDNRVRTKNFKLALPYFMDSIALAKAKGKPAVEARHSLLRVIYYELKDYNKVKSTLKYLVTNWPKKAYFMELANANYVLSGKNNISKSQVSLLEKQQMLYFEMAYIQGMLKTQGDYTTMAQLYQYHGTPSSASKLLKKAIQDKKIDSVQKNYESLAQSYIAGGDYKKALRSLKKAADLAKTSKLYARYAYICYQVYDYKCSADYFKRALDKKDLSKKRLSSIYMSKGISEVNLRRYKTAKLSFKSAMDVNKKSRKIAKSWLKRADYEALRYEEVKKYLHKK